MQGEWYHICKSHDALLTCPGFYAVKQIGPTPELLERFGDKTAAREAAIAAGVPVVEGSEAMKTFEEAAEFANSVSYPVIIKAAMGGGGRGMRVVHSEEEMKEAFSS